MALGTPTSAVRQNPHFSTQVIPNTVAQDIVLSTGGGVATMTTDQLLSGFLCVDCQDNQTLNVPTAAAINAAIPGVKVGSRLNLDIINYGDSTITVAVNTGVTNRTIATVVSVLTILTLASKRFILVCTGVKGQDGATADAWVLYGLGPTAAAVA